MAITIATALVVLLAKGAEPPPTKTYVTGFVAALKERIEDTEYLRFRAFYLTLWWRTSDPDCFKTYISVCEFHEWRRGLREDAAKLRKLNVELLVLHDITERARREAEKAEREVNRVKREVLEELRQQKKKP